MPTLYIRDFPNELYQKLKNVARAHRRSATQEAIVVLEKALSSLPPDKTLAGASASDAQASGRDQDAPNHEEESHESNQARA